MSTVEVMTIDESGVIAQAQGREILINYIKIADNIDSSNIGMFGYSWGGLSNIIDQMRSDYVKAVVSWGGSIEYHRYSIWTPSLKVSGISFMAITITGIPFAKQHFKLAT